MIMNELMGSIQMIQNPAILLFIFKGLAFTLILSIVAIVLSILGGSVLALVRNYCTKPGQRIFRWIAVVYIEIFRNTPLLFWIFIGLVFFPAPKIFAHHLFGLSSVETKILFKATLSLTLFEAAIIAEIIRGGLNAIAKGQFEAGYAQGFSTVQVMRYIILPQAYRNVVPTLLSQVITTIKDSSFLANVATIELMSRVKKILSNASLYNGIGTINVSDVFVLFGIAAIIYFVINYALSCAVRHIQKRTQQKAMVYQTAKA